MGIKDILSRIPLVPNNDLKALGENNDYLRLGSDIGLQLAYPVVLTQDGPRIVSAPKVGTIGVPNGSTGVGLNVRMPFTGTPHEFFPLGVHNDGDTSDIFNFTDLRRIVAMLNITVVPGDGSTLKIFYQVQNPQTLVWNSVRQFALTGNYSTTGPNDTETIWQDVYGEGGSTLLLSDKMRFKVILTGAKSPFTFELGGYFYY